VEILDPDGAVGLFGLLTQCIEGIRIVEF